MAELGGSFDSGKHDDMNSGFDPIPAGEYLAKVVESDFLQNSKKNGKYIKLKFEIIQGEFKGRFIWTNLNVLNPSQVAVDIANKELATLCRAVGVPKLKDTNQLHGKPIKMKIKIKPAKGDYPAGNEPIGYAPATNQAGADPSEDSGAKEPDQISDADGDIPWGSE